MASAIAAAGLRSRVRMMRRRDATHGEHILPSKVHAYLPRLLLNYGPSGTREWAAIIKHGRVAVDVEKDRDW